MQLYKKQIILVVILELRLLIFKNQKKNLIILTRFNIVYINIYNDASN